LHTSFEETMKKTPYILFIVALLMVLVSCGKDRWSEYYEYTGDNLWIDEVMRNYYLWEEELPDTEELTSKYFASNAAFLSEVKFKEDTYSSIDSLTAQKPDYGMEYTLMPLSDEGIYAALVTYVEPTSPAGIAGIERGTWIMKVDKEDITSENQATFLKDGQDHLLTMGRYNVVTDEDGNEQTYIQSYAYAPLKAVATYDKLDVPLYKVLSVGDTKVGYLFCNRFTEQTTSLLTATEQFSQAGITELVLDLRRNDCSTIEGMQLLASLVAPASAQGKALAVMTYNSLAHPEWPDYYTLNTPGGGINLNLDRLFVLTSNSTKGMAEHLVHCLKHYMEVVVIGTQTAGEIYGTQLFDNETYGLQLRLVTSAIADADGHERSGPLSPDETVNDLSDPLKIKPFGDVEEALLEKAIEKLKITATP